ncbi:1-acyl-sn-glycerol-3-phosphate acyltransferase [Deinococcus sp.]|uniref:lysophospholipid acyltransferase family protein n=1 Tax=Deinococcus sp. TaxID=47478 RepID=UPI0025BFF181|nr:lysophospholipid acyltransferase family protein [Deinococcus sp.]
MSDAASSSAGSAAGKGAPTTALQPEPVIPQVIPLVYRAVVDALYLPVLFSGMHLEVHGREHVPPPGTPLVVAANHMTNLDPFLVARALPPGRFLQFMAKKELFVPVVGQIIRAGGSFAVDRSGNDVGAVRTAVRILRDNGTVGIFPQGHRGGEEMRGGVALIAAKSRAPILPAGLSRDGKRWIVRFGEPLPVSGGIKGTTAALEQVLRELAQPVGSPV